MNIETTCHGCYWLRHGANKSDACTLGRIPKFAANGATIEEDLGFPIIKGRHCNAKRPLDWAQDKPKANLDVILRAENLVRTDVIIYMEEYVHSALESTIESLKKQVLKPLTTIVICNCKPQAAKLIKLMDESGLNYRVTSNKEKLPKNYCIDLEVKKSVASYYQLMDAGHYLHHEWLAELDEAINDRLRRFLYVEESITRGPTVSVSAHSVFYGNEPCPAKVFKQDAPEDLVLSDIKGKLKFSAETNGNTYYIVDQSYVLA